MKRIVFFNPIELLPFLVFLIGLFFKVFHLSYADIIVISTAPFALVIYVLQHILHRDKSAIWVKLLLSAAKVLWLFYFSSKILFWENTQIIFYITVTISVAAIVLSIYKRQLVIMQGILLGFFIACGVFLMVLPNHTLYYTIYMASDAKQHPEDYYYQDWNKYSWLLYQDKMYDEALDANFLALKSAIANKADSSALQRLQEHKERIEQQNWENFDNLLPHQ